MCRQGRCFLRCDAVWFGRYRLFSGTYYKIGDYLRHIPEDGRFHSQRLEKLKSDGVRYFKVS